ncbi:MAG: hypothetical protein WDN67_01020 [Candidatus Moraniibacteriota bacterium]
MPETKSCDSLKEDAKAIPLMSSEEQELYRDNLLLRRNIAEEEQRIREFRGKASFSEEQKGGRIRQSSGGMQEHVEALRRQLAESHCPF